MVVLATGAMENARLLLASNDVATAGVGNGNDLVGRFFSDHPIPRDGATLVVFDGRLASFYPNNTTAKGDDPARDLLAQRSLSAGAQRAGFAHHGRKRGQAGRARTGCRGDDRGCAGRRRHQCESVFDGLRHGARARSQAPADAGKRTRCARHAATEAHHARPGFALRALPRDDEGAWAASCSLRAPA